MIGDGHTRVEAYGKYHRFPLELFWFEQELRIIRTSRAHERALGTRIIRIGEHELEVVLARLHELIPQAENDWFVRHHSVQQVVQAEPLAALGIVPWVGTVPFTFEADHGTRFVLQLEPMPPDSRLDWLDLWSEKPLHLRSPDTALWSMFLADSRMVYVSFRRYDDLSNNARLLWECVDSHPVDRLVIDMRHNSGGNYAQGASIWRTRRSRVGP